MQLPARGQRWMSTSDPLLGLGRVVGCADGRVELWFGATGEKRVYALDSAPLVRVRFEPGDEVVAGDGLRFEVEEVVEDGGLLVYRGGGHELSEGRLCDNLSFVRPDKRLLAGLACPPRAFDQRMQALAWRTRVMQSDVRGLAGGRIELIDHQLAVVDEVCRRVHPRVMLADEVGLGKTIEACLVLHHLQLTGRASRVLILVPEPLVHQWFVELLRRFNLLFALFDEARCAAIETGDPGANPFLDSQLVLAATGFLAADDARVAQACAAGFDLLIVDEAHHLEWSPDAVSAAYGMVESLARAVPSLLLLTATPEQLGPDGHFARLRLLDPDRYNDLATFRDEAESYAGLATAVDALRDGRVPDGLAELVRCSPMVTELHRALLRGDVGAREPLIAALIDFFGTGRVLFRNTRDHLRGFPQRRPHLHPLAAGDSPYHWLASWLRRLPVDEKVLLITGTPEGAVATQEKLLEQMHVESGLFHEGMTLLQRDRQAAWFAEPDGARILICSEIGSEGRNFQFARHLVLFGLPRDPELLEQRIGRLDRIGQTGSVHIHVPYGVRSRSELHVRWLHEGLDAFRKPLKGAGALAAALLPQLEALDVDDSLGLERFLDASRTMKERVLERLASGHDRLLELSVPPVSRIQSLKRMIRECDADAGFESFVVALFDQLGLDVTELSSRVYHFHRGIRHSEAFADLPEEGISATFDRSLALAREDLAFMTPDHPVFLSALDHLLGGESGNASFAVWRRGSGKEVWLECAFVVEVLAPAGLHVSRYLPPTVLRVVVDHRGEVISDPLPVAVLLPGDSRQLVMQDAFRRRIFPTMLAAARAAAGRQAAGVVATARRRATAETTAERDRLRDLASRNPKVLPAEVEALQQLAADLDLAVSRARLRLDALRVIWCA